MYIYVCSTGIHMCGCVVMYITRSPRGLSRSFCELLTGMAGGTEVVSSEAWGKSFLLEEPVTIHVCACKLQPNDLWLI